MAPAAAAVVLALVALDVSATALALPSLRLTLGTSSSGLVWIQVAWLLGLALAMCPAELLARDGAWRRLVRAGLVLLTVGGALCAVAQDTAVVVAGAALAGAGAGAALACLPAAALRRWALLPALALLIGPVLGGGLAELQSWRWVFGAEAAAGAAALLLAWRGAPHAHEARGRNPAPLHALALQAAGLVLAALGLVQAEVWGWGSAATILVLAAGFAALALSPAFRNRPPGAIGVLAVAGTLITFLLLMPEYLALSRGLSPLRVGLLMLSVTGPAVLLGALVSRLPAPGRRRAPAVGGLLVAGLAALAFARLDADSSYRAIIPALALLGGGLGAGAAGLLPGHERVRELLTAVAVACTLVVAGAGALFQHAQGREREDGGSFEQALAEGLAVSVWLPAALLAAAALLAWRSAGPRPEGSRARPAEGMRPPPRRPA